SAGPQVLRDGSPALDPASLHSTGLRWSNCATDQGCGTRRTPVGAPGGVTPPTGAPRLIVFSAPVPLLPTVTCRYRTPCAFAVIDEVSPVATSESPEIAVARATARE